MHKAPDEEIEERIRITSEIMGIGFRTLLQRKPGTLSGGQQQRVAIARAIVRRPQVFLFDEPLSNLDAKLRSQTRVEIKRLLRRFSITALYVTHDQTEAMAIGDQVAVMRAGQIEQVGSFEEVRRRPVNTFVAGFLGIPPMRLLHGAEVSGGGIRLGHDLGIRLHPTQLETLNVGDNLTIGIRPESIQVRVADGELTPENEGVGTPPANIWRGTVESVESDFGRHLQMIGFRCGDHRLLGQASVRDRIAQGEQIEAQVDERELHFFDAESGARLN